MLTGERTLAWLLLAVLLLLIGWFARHDAAEYRAFKALTATEDRQRTLRRWIASAFALFFVGGVGVLVVLGRIEAAWRLPPEFAAVSGALVRTIAGHDTGGPPSGLLFLVAGALLAGGILGGLLSRNAGNGKARLPSAVGDIEPLFPRNAGERRWLALLAANAGLSEELFFRLALPLVITLATGSAPVAFAAACLLFGALHVYQGVTGMLATTVLGALFTGFYLATGSLWAAMLLHALLNLNGLLVRPWLARGGSAGR